MKIHHLTVVSKSLDKYRCFPLQILGLKQHPIHSSWFVSEPAGFQLHVIEIDESKANLSDMHHYYRHVAFEVPDLRPLVEKSIALGLVAFQMDENGEEQVISNSASLDFGLKTVFTRDPDDNLWEFVQRGRSWNELFN